MDADRHGVSPGDAHPRIRTFHARHGRVTPAMRRAFAEVGPRHALDRALERALDRAQDRQTRDQRAGTRKLVLEVGCGHGDAALAFADAHPHVDVLAVDVHTPGIAHLLQALDAEPRSNVFVQRGDALDVLDDVLATASLHGVHVFFPDPWPKARHHKRRFVRPDIADLLADRLAPHGMLRAATDDASYAADMARTLGGHTAFEGSPATRPSWRPTAGYEQRALDAGRPVFEFAYRRLGP